MSDSSSHSIYILPNKPLVEAIFELRWRLDDSETLGINRDPHFPIVVGRFYDRVHSQYPELEDLPSSKVPEELTPYIVRHRFRAGKGSWPVTQIGPGIMSVNETDGYTWESFRGLIEHAVNAFVESYPSANGPQIERVELRYIDAIPFSYRAEKGNILDFLEKELHTTIKIDGELFNHAIASPDPLSLNLEIPFPLLVINGVGVISITTGKKNDENAIIMTTTVQTSPTSVPQDRPGVISWLDEAHVITSKWFRTLVRGNLLHRFEVSP